MKKSVSFEEKMERVMFLLFFFMVAVLCYQDIYLVADVTKLGLNNPLIKFMGMFLFGLFCIAVKFRDTKAFLASRDKYLKMGSITLIAFIGMYTIKALLKINYLQDWDVISYAIWTTVCIHNILQVPKSKI